MIALHAVPGDLTRIRYTVVDGEGGYFQNVKRLVAFSSERVVFGGRKGQVTVEGSDLSLGKYCDGDVAVFGNIEGVFREGFPKEKP